MGRGGGGGGGGEDGGGGGKLVIEVLTLTQTRDRFKTFLDYLRVVLNDNSHWKKKVNWNHNNVRNDMRILK